MFDKNFNAESSVKKWAKAIRVIGWVIMGLSGFLAFLMLCVNIEDLWLGAFIILISGGLMLFSAIFFSTIIWSFGDLVGNVKKMSGSRVVAQNEQYDSTDLPEL